MERPPCWIKGTAMGSPASSSSPPGSGIFMRPTSSSSPARPTSSPRAQLFSFPSMTSAAACSSSSSPSQHQQQHSTPLGATRPRSGAQHHHQQQQSHASSQFSATPPRSSPRHNASAAAAATTSTSESQNFHRGVMDALHDVLKERRVSSTSSRPATTTSANPNDHSSGSIGSASSSSTAAAAAAAAANSIPRPQPPTPFHARTGSGTYNAIGVTPRRPLGSARRATVPVSHLFSQQTSNNTIGQEQHQQQPQQPSYHQVPPTTSATMSSFFPASDLEETLRKKRSQWAQRHQQPSNAAPSSSLSYNFKESARSSCSSFGSFSSPTMMPNGNQQNMSSTSASSSFFDLGATSPLHSNPGSQHSSFRQMQQQQQDRDGYFARSFTHNHQQQTPNIRRQFPATANNNNNVAATTTSATTSSTTPSSHFGPSSDGSTSSASDTPTPPPPLAQQQQQQTAQIVSQLKLEGNRLYAQKKYIDAHRVYSQGLEVDPQNAVLLSNRAAVYLCMNSVDAAVRDCQQAVGIDPTFWRAHVRLGRAYALRGACDKALESSQRALSLVGDAAAKQQQQQPPQRPQSSAIGANHASSSSNNANSTSAASLEQEVQNIRNQINATKIWERARFEHEGGSPSNALRLLDDELFRDSVFADDMAVRIFKSRLQLQLFESSACKNELGKFIPHVTSALEAMLNLNFTLFPAPVGAVPPLAIPPMLSGFVAGLCELLVASARAAMLTGWHHAANARSTLKLCFMLRPDFAQAVQLERTVVTVSSHIEEAALAMSEGRAAEAHAGLTVALTADPANTKLRMNLLLLRSEASIALGRHEAAATDCTEVLSSEPNNTRALLRRSQAFERAQNYPLARRDMEAAVALQPELEEELGALMERLRAAGASCFSNSSEQQSYNNNSDNARRKGSARGARRNSNGNASSRPSSSSSFRFTNSNTDNNSGGYNNYSSSASHQPQPQQPTLYDVLGVPRDADTSTIRSQYRRLTLQVHPDKVVGQAQEVRRQCEERFKQISQAYAVLSDEDQRGEYDVSLLMSTVVAF